MRHATVLLAMALMSTPASGQNRIDELPGWKVASDKELFGETFVVEFTKAVAELAKLDQGHYFDRGGAFHQRLPEDRQPTLEAVRKKHGNAKTISEVEVMMGVSNTFQPIAEKLRFHVYGRFGLGVSPKDPNRIQWVRLMEAPTK